jgi:hypothetical protein
LHSCGRRLRFAGPPLTLRRGLFGNTHRLTMARKPFLIRS